MTPLSQVQDQIRTQLVSQKKNDAVNDWVANVEKEYKGKVQYAVGLRAARHLDDHRRDHDLRRVTSGAWARTGLFAIFVI